MVQGFTTPKEDEESRKRDVRSGMRLTERDIAVLEWIGQQYVVCLDQLQHLLGQRADRQTKDPGVLTLRRTRATVERWREAGLVHYQKILNSHLSFVWLSTRGIAHTGLGYRSFTPTAATLLHHYSVNQARLFVASRRPEASWRSERHLRSLYQGRRQRARKVPHIPDGELCFAGGGTVAIEVELTAKSLGRLVEIVDDLAGRYESIWYFVDRPVQSLLEEAVESLDRVAQQRFQFHSLSVLRGREAR